mmetsp:Transcript_65858/g.104896  ORF Transcript_65858/g.104896 Transcript_65858/m.104896 type:complete len:126 (+) Transcript_65858:22-399(+)
MRILVRAQRNEESNKLNEWCILELQGTITSSVSTTLHDMSLGKLNFNTEGNPVLTIGNNVLSGVIQKLSKPLLVTHKKAIDIGNDEQKELTVVAIVKSKIVFKHRPKIVLMNSSPSNKQVHLSQI